MIVCGKRCKFVLHNVGVADIQLLHHLTPTSLRNSLRKLTLEQSAQEVEFRILHNVFCETYTLQRNAIDFDEYCSRCYEKYLLGLVTISPISKMTWRCGLMYGNLFFIFVFVECRLVYFVFVNAFELCEVSRALAVLVRLGSHFLTLNCIAFIVWFQSRIKLGLEFADCSNHVKDSESYTRCKYESDLNLFVVAGFCLFGLTLTMAFLTRMYEVRLMNTRGVESLDDYATFLEVRRNHRYLSF